MADEATAQDDTWQDHVVEFRARTYVTEEVPAEQEEEQEGQENG